MIFSDKDIKRAYYQQKIVIDPFDEKNVNTSSYDVRLGPNYYRETLPKEPPIIIGGVAHYIYNMYDFAETSSVWELHKAVLAKDFFSLIGKSLKNISDDDEIILIGPHETILGHTIEFIGARVKATTMMKARSSLGRNFIEMCKCAGMGDIGYTNIWTMEITNNSQYRHIPLVVGRRVAQILFMETGDTSRDYGNEGKYQFTSDIEDLKINWHPTMMLPRMDRDREIKIND